jgi:hypothetical protein
MGLDLTVRFPSGAVPGWDVIRGRLARVGASAPLRLIDGLPAFPDEVPEGDWSELRIGLPEGMVALRRSGAALTCVVWGGADAALLAARDRVAWACAAAGSGLVEAPGGAVGADEYARLCRLAPE